MSDQNSYALLISHIRTICPTHPILLVFVNVTSVEGKAHYYVFSQRLRWYRGSVLAFGSRGSHPAEAVGFLGRKNPQHAFFRRGSKAVGPMS